eukprot:7154064-Ditylum_brightwellii.AAC.1
MLHVAKACDTKKTTVVHKFAQKYGFKGSWDTASKLVKQTIDRLELQNDRVVNAYDCYIKLGRGLNRDGTKKETLKLLEYERIGGKRVLDNTPMQTRHTFVGYGTEYKE